MNDPLYIQLGRLIEKHGHTNQSLANLTGIPIGTISGIRSGQNQSPSLEAICAIMKALGESVDVLVGIVPPLPQINTEQLNSNTAEIIRTYQIAIAGYEGQLEEKDKRSKDLEKILEDTIKRANRMEAIAIGVLIAFAMLFLVDLCIRTRGWITW